MMVFRNLFTIVFGLLATSTLAQKPKWVDNTPQELNHTYKFVEVISYATDIASAREEAKKKLASNEQLVRTVQVNVETGKLRKVEQTVTNGKMDETIRDKVDIQMKVSGKQFDLQAYPVDEYFTHEQGMVKMHTLYMVAVQDDPVFDRTYLTTNYGATPIAMSIIPGLGQWYKGSKIKGICMFGATAAAVAGIIICNNEANTAEKNIKLEPKYAKHYEDKKSNWETGRNICIGAAAAIWIYNMIDAAVAKGARRVEVKPAGRSYVSLTPALNTDYAGLSLSYNF